MTEIPKIRPGDVLEMKKSHPCGSARFEVLRVGTDVRIVCLGCGRDVTVPRLKLERSVRRILPGEEKK
ncbi:MAG: DUF951 domain-containing protein [Clostridia bacterium]|nr:DUF951 domain-containing protein [Clostridia bacterium]